MNKILFLFFVILFTSCNIAVSESPMSSIVLKYNDFGPPAIANDLIGMDWWQWQNHGDSRPSEYDIKVVVFRNVSLNSIRNNYPAMPDRNKDYRYIKYKDTLKYLDEHIKVNLIQNVTKSLRIT